MIFITHRLSTARRADKIAMMQNGVRPFELLAAAGRSCRRLTASFVVRADDHRIWDAQRAPRARRGIRCAVQRIGVSHIFSCTISCDTLRTEGHIYTCTVLPYANI